MDLQARTERLAQLLEHRLDIRGAGFEVKLKSAGRLLPRYVRKEGALLVEALRQAAHPRLARRLDIDRLSRAADALERHLLDVDPWDRRRGIAVMGAASVLFKLLVVAALALGVLFWRDYL